MYASLLHQYFLGSLPLQPIYWQPSCGHPVLVFLPLLLYRSHLDIYRALLLDHTTMRVLPFSHFNLLIFFGSGKYPNNWFEKYQPMIHRLWTIGNIFWRSMKNGSVSWAVACALSYFYMVSAWGGYVYIINLIPLHVLGLALESFFILKICQKYTEWSHLSSSSYG